MAKVPLPPGDQWSKVSSSVCSGSRSREGRHAPSPCRTPDPRPDPHPGRDPGPRAGCHLGARTGGAGPRGLRATRPATRADRPGLLLRHGRPVRQRRHLERRGRPDRRPERDRVRPHQQGVLQRRRPRRPAPAPRLHRRPGHRRDLADPGLQEQAGAARGRPVGRLPRLLDHRLHPGRPPPGHQPGPHRPRGRGARPRHQGLLRHHHQPHRGRHRLHGRRPDGVRLQGRGALPRRRGRPVRRPRLRRQPGLPGARPGHVVPLRARPRPGRGGPQGPRLAQRRDELPQPRQHDLHAARTASTATSSASTTSSPRSPRWSTG